MYDGASVAEVVGSLLTRRPFVAFHLAITGDWQVKVAAPEAAWLENDGELIYVTHSGHTDIVPSAKVAAVSVAMHLPRGG